MMSNAASLSGEPLATPDVSASLKRTLTTIAVVRGAVLLVLGLVLLFWPKATLTVVAVLIGLQLVLMGIIRFALLFTREAEGWVKALEGLLGVLLVLAGVVCMKAPFGTLVFLLIVVALGWLIDGVASFVGAIHPFDGWRMLYAGLCIVAAVAVLAWPELALTTFVAVAAWFLILLGILQLVLAWRARSA
jgi:uncharacterized membrane protein HdeD (DUF308 family)